MRTTIPALFFLLVYTVAFGAREGDGSAHLNPNVVQHVYLGAGLVTTLQFQSDQKITSAFPGSPIVHFEYIEEHNQLNIFPLIDRGVTNLNVTIGGATYVFILNITSDNRVQYRRTFSFTGETDRIASAAMRDAPRLRPNEIPVSGIIRSIEQAAIDPVFRRTLSDYVEKSVNRVYQWNNCLVYLTSVHSIPSKDITVLKIEWVNTTAKGLYLHARQIGVWVANTEIKVAARSQRSPTVLPGERDSIYLFIQGERISWDNPWDLALPPESDAVRAILGPR